MNIRKLKKRNAKNQYEHRVNRKYKDSLFRKIFSDRKDLLDLYNALNGTLYTNADGWKSIPYLWQRCARRWEKAAIKGKQ